MEDGFSETLILLSRFWDCMELYCPTASVRLDLHYLKLGIGQSLNVVEAAFHFLKFFFIF